jgi:hypothetical protein
VNVRRVPWAQVPLGAVIIDWPRLHNAWIPELLDYPVITARLRSYLGDKYQFLSRTAVTIADPTSVLEPTDFGTTDFKSMAEDARRVVEGIPAVNARKRAARGRILSLPDAKEGILRSTKYEDGPFTLTKDRMKSTSGIIRDGRDFGEEHWGPAQSLERETVGTMLGKMLSGELPRIASGSTSVDIGIDVSRSMTETGKAALALGELLDLASTLARDLGFSVWRVWLVSDRVVPCDWGVYRKEQLPPLDSLLSRSRIVPGETRFAPFFRKVLDQGGASGTRLCILLTDGAYQDRAESLRLLERVGNAGIDYLQLLLFRDEENRNAVIGAEGDIALDGIVLEKDIGANNSLLIRTDEELSEYCLRELADATDLAEAARGGQLVINWYDLLELVTIDVYDRFIGKDFTKGWRKIL